jgi:hypothetical protein
MANQSPIVPSDPAGKPGAPLPVPGAAAKSGPPQPAGTRPAPVPIQAGPLGEVSPEEYFGPPLSFWQQPWVQNILPFATSLSVHAAILILGLMVFGVVKMATQPPREDQVIIPDSNMVDNGPPGGIPNTGLGGDPLRQAAQDKDPTTETKGWADKKGPSVDPSPAGAAGDSASVFDAGAMGSIGGGKGNTGNGAGDGSGALAMYGTPGGGGIGPKGPVFGNGGNARYITFVCDASGSMINKMASLKDQLNKAIVGLKPIQSFNVIFFQDNKCDAVVKDGLVSATPENKRKASTFLEGVTTTGTTDPIPGIEMAFKAHPQLVYILTDGDFPDNDAVLKKIRELNKDKKVKINTIAFVGASDNDTAFLKLLETIAKENGGSFKHVNEGDL